MLVYVSFTSTGMSIDPSSTYGVVAGVQMISFDLTDVVAGRATTYSFYLNLIELVVVPTFA